LLEMELKFQVDDLEVYARTLEEKGIGISDEVHEKNLVLDRMGRPLGKRDILLRLRNCSRGTLVTVKRPLPSTALKVRQEREAVLNCSTEDALDLFELLGYGVVYRYEKKRRTALYENAVICLDSLWFGDYVEIEASSEEDVLKSVELLGFLPDQGIRFSYAALEKEAKSSQP